MAQAVHDVWGALVSQSPFKVQSFGAGDRHILLVGGEQSGKTSLQSQFFRQTDEPRPTLALNYQSCRANVGGQPAPLHFWELGGGVQLESLLDAIVTNDTRPGFFIFICLDLTSPSSLFDAIQWLDRLPTRFPDRPGCSFLMCTHYDGFQVRDPRDRDVIVRGLRALAAQRDVGLCFTSTRLPELAKRFEDVIKYVVLGGRKLKSIDLSPGRAIIVGPGQDPDARGDSEGLAAMMNQLSQEAAAEREKSPKETANMAENPQFAEDEMDSLRAARRKELAEKVQAKKS